MNELEQLAFDPYRIQVDTQGVAGWTTPAAYVAGQSFNAVKPSNSKRERTNQGGSGDKHIDRWSRFELQQTAYEMDRNNGLSVRLIDAAVENICGDCGFGLNSKADGKSSKSRKWSDKIEYDWWEWLEKVCDPAQELHGIDRLSLVEAAKHQIGDAFIQWDETGGDGEGQFRVIEATRCIDPAGATDIDGYKLSNGIARDKSTKEAKWYWIADEVPQTSNVSLDDGRPYRAENFIHYYSPRRESQTVGLPATTAIIRDFDDVDDILMFERVGAKLACSQGIFIESQHGGEMASYYQGLALGNGGYDPRDRVTEVTPGAINYLRPGETPKLLQGDRPSQDLQSYIRLLIRLVGIPLAVPYEWLTLDFTLVNLGSLRVLLSVIQRNWRRQQFRHGAMLSKLFRFWIEQQIKRGRYPDKPDIRQHDWRPPRWPSPQPVQDANANKIAIEGGWGCLTDAAEQAGGDIDRVAINRQKEKDAGLLVDKSEKSASVPTDKNGNPQQTPPGGQK